MLKKFLNRLKEENFRNILILCIIMAIAIIIAVPRLINEHKEASAKTGYIMAKVQCPLCKAHTMKQHHLNIGLLVCDKCGGAYSTEILVRNIGQ